MYLVTTQRLLLIMRMGNLITNFTKFCLKFIAKLILSRISESLFIYKKIKKNKIHVFLYHDISTNPSNFSKTYELNVTPENFEKQLKFIKENYQIISPNNLLNVKKITKPLALITFDDGLRSYFDIALPILEAFDCPSLFFLNGGPIQKEPFWSGLAVYLCNHDKEFSLDLSNRKFLKTHGARSYLYLKKSQVHNFFNNNNRLRETIYKKVNDFHGGFANEDDLIKVDGHPLVFFGNHLFNHYNAANITTSELITNYTKNSEYLARFKSFIPDIISYPFGHPETCFNQSTNIALKKSGAKLIFSAISGGNKSINQSIIQRIAMTDNLKSKQDIMKHITSRIISSWYIRFKKRKLFQIRN